MVNTSARREISVWMLVKSVGELSIDSFGIELPSQIICCPEVAL